MGENLNIEDARSGSHLLLHCRFRVAFLCVNHSPVSFNRTKQTSPKRLFFPKLDLRATPRPLRCFCPQFVSFPVLRFRLVLYLVFVSFLSLSLLYFLPLDTVNSLPVWTNEKHLIFYILNQPLATLVEIQATHLFGLVFLTKGKTKVSLLGSCVSNLVASTGECYLQYGVCFVSIFVQPLNSCSHLHSLLKSLLRSFAAARSSVAITFLCLWDI